jgi:hypothetical protein
VLRKQKVDQQIQCIRKGFKKLSMNRAQQAAKINVARYTGISTGNFTCSEKISLR